MVSSDRSFKFNLQPPSLSRSSKADNPSTRIVFLELLLPEAMVMEERGTFKKFAKNSMQARLAFPSIGGAVSDSLIASPILPVMAFFLARGWTLTAKVTKVDSKTKMA